MQGVNPPFVWIMSTNVAAPTLSLYLASSGIAYRIFPSKNLGPAGSKPIKHLDKDGNGELS